MWGHVYPRAWSKKAERDDSCRCCGKKASSTFWYHGREFVHCAVWRKQEHLLLINLNTKLGPSFETGWGHLRERERKSLSSVQLLSRVLLFVTPWIAAHQASLFITNSQSSPKLLSVKSVMSSSHLILCCPLLLLPPIPPSIRVFSDESTLHMRWPKY